MKWTIVAFDHPEHSKSVLYRQGMTDKGLLKAIETAISKGANLMSIRGFNDAPTVVYRLSMEEKNPLEIDLERVITA